MTMLNKIYLEQILAQFSEGKLRDVTLKLIGSSLKEEDSQRCVAAQINKYLSSSISKIDGCELLSECLPKFSPDVITEYGPGWIRFCVNHSEHDKSKDIYLNTLAKIVEYSQNSADFDKKFVSDYLHLTLDSCLQKIANLFVKEASLRCLVSVLKYYSSSCNSYKKRLEEYVLRYLNTSSHDLVVLAGAAFYYCQQIGGAGVDRCNYINNITMSLRRLCVTCHKQLDLLFQDQLEFDNFEANDIEALSIEAPPLHFNNYMKMKSQVQVLKNVINWLVIFLSGSMNNSFYFNEFLSVIQRSLSLHVCLEQNRLSVETSHFSIHLMEVQRDSLKLLGVFIRQAASLLQPFYSSITKIILDLVSRSQNCSCYNKDNYSIQECIYDVLSTWLDVGCISFDQTLQDKVVSCIIRDAFPVATGVTLKITTNAVGKSPKKKNKIMNNKIAAMSMSSDSSSMHMKNFKFRVTFSALKTLNILLNNVYLQIKDPLLNKLNTSIIKTLLSIQSGQEVFPYDKRECQSMLYEIVCVLFEQNSIPLLPPIQTVQGILLNGSRSEDLDIAAVCRRGLNTMEKICQPVCSSMHTHVERSNGSSTIQETSSFDDDQEISASILDDIPNGIDHTEEQSVKKNVEVLCNNIIVPPNPPSPEHSEEIIEIEDNTVLEDNDEREIGVHDDVIDLVSEDLSERISTLDSPPRSSRRDGIDYIREEPASKRMRVEEVEDESMLDSLVDEVHKEYN